MAQRMLQESGTDGRSVLGMLEVQVEKDPKTGATVVRSVAPASSPIGSPKATMIFDDGRKSIHTVGGSPGQPSSQELNQILTAIDGVGMKVLLDEVTVTPNKMEGKSVEDRKHQENTLPFTSHYTVSKDDNTSFGGSKSNHSEAKTRVEKFSVDVSKPDYKSTMLVKDFAEQVDYIEDKRLEQGPVTLMFMGYTDDASTENASRENDQTNIKVERVMITDDGEEHVLGPEPFDSPSKKAVKQNDGKGAAQEVFRDVPLEGKGGEGQGEEGSKRSSSPTGAKRKSCQCCSVM